MEYDRLNVEPCEDGALLVRVQSSDPKGQALPDAVFTFRPGDPQYAYLKEQLAGGNSSHV